MDLWTTFRERLKVVPALAQVVVLTVLVVCAGAFTLIGVPLMILWGLAKGVQDGSIWSVLLGVALVVAVVYGLVLAYHLTDRYELTRKVRRWIGVALLWAIGAMVVVDVVTSCSFERSCKPSRYIDC